MGIAPGCGSKPVYKCSLTNDTYGYEAIDNCELLIDSGNTACDLLITWHDALKFGLRPSSVTQTVTCANQEEAVLVQLMPQLLIQFSLEDDAHNTKVKAAHLDVWVMSDEIPNLSPTKPLWTPPGTQTQILGPPSTSPPVNKPRPEKKCSLVKHTALCMANLGKSGCKKLCLNYDFENDSICFIELKKEDLQEI